MTKLPANLKARNRAVGLVLLAVFLLLFFITIVRIQAGMSVGHG